MHRKHRAPHGVTWLSVAGLALAVWSLGGPAPQAPAAPAQAGPQADPGHAGDGCGKVVVLINGTRTVQMTTGKNLKTVTNQDPTVARVAAVPEDPTRVQITGLRAGMTRLTMTDVTGAQESSDVLVQINLAYLYNVLSCVAPTAHVCLIPASENTIILNGTVCCAEDIDVIVRTAQAAGGYQIINHLRTCQVSQVQLCVVIARVSRSLGRNFGFNFLFNSGRWLGGSTVGNVIPPLAPVGVPSVQLTPPDTIGQVLNSAPNAANVFGGAISNHAGFLGFLEALEAEGLAKVMAEPRLVTLSGRPASFLDGGEQAIPVPAGLGQVGVQFEEFGVRLNFLPIVLCNGKIHLEVEPEISEISNNPQLGTAIGGVVVAGRQTQRVHTTVELEDGQTFAIGGLIQKQHFANAAKVPVIGQLPFVGALFSTKNYTDEENELVVLVTPHLVDAMDCQQAPKMLPGDETRSPDDFELFLEGIMEAPRGPREVFPGGHYLPAYQNGPTAGQFPCAPPRGPHGIHGCAGGHCEGNVPGEIPADVTGPETSPLPVTDTPKAAPQEQAPVPKQQGEPMPPPDKNAEASPASPETQTTVTPVSLPQAGADTATNK
jgi:pilus assembly protein CpaC